MKNLQIYSSCLKFLKEADLEMIANDIVVSAKTVSDIISRPSIVANPEYAKDKEKYLSEAYEVVNCESEVC